MKILSIILALLPVIVKWIKEIIDIIKEENPPLKDREIKKLTVTRAGRALAHTTKAFREGSI